jgi:hypothetical protein
MQIAVIGIDLGKNICSLAGLDGSGQVDFEDIFSAHAPPHP